MKPLQKFVNDKQDLLEWMVNAQTIQDLEATPNHALGNATAYPNPSPNPDPKHSPNSYHHIMFSSAPTIYQTLTLTH